MDAQFHTSFQRMEQALQRLTDTIAAYSPSTTAADELVAADDALSANLKQLVHHQRNHLRIQELKRITENNDEKLKNYIRSLAELRKEITAIPSTERTISTRQASVDELLSYANFLSPTTVPPTLRRKPDVQTEPRGAPHVTNGMATPPAGAQGADSAAKAGNTEVKDEPDEAPANSYIAWEPWPSQGAILSGALADIQRLVEAGQDPASILTPAEQAEQDRLRAEEKEREEKEELERLREKRERGQFDTYDSRFANAGVFNPDD
ncbi:mediator of RNA polymerase II transcription subunit 4-like [Teratosphaeria destructans]|uniref:Mediator of RNA polymerase II transcription subunit 4 n=1 Tax=Teratosphaeria destructans TaxID=418781 RepID=A0A9W7SI32_9PEZI|nr:mediator of RNA polymerase II transcription subunit 4-like [Teratosphaeria destructans]